MLVVVEGLIGCGKSTLCERLKSCGVCDGMIPEPVNDNPYLSDFYQNPERYAFEMQVFLLNQRYLSFQKAQHDMLLNPEKALCADRSFYGDYAFALQQKAAGTLEARAFDNYRRLHNSYQMLLQFPQLFIWLECEPVRAIERICKRARTCESGIPLDYLDALRTAYQVVLNELQRKTQVVVIDANRGEDDVYEDVARVIERRKGEIARLVGAGSCGYMGGY